MLSFQYIQHLNLLGFHQYNHRYHYFNTNKLTIHLSAWKTNHGNCHNKLSFMCVYALKARITMQISYIEKAILKCTFYLVWNCTCFYFLSWCHINKREYELLKWVCSFELLVDLKQMSIPMTLLYVEII